MEIEVNKRNLTYPETLIEDEPHIIIGNPDKYLVIIYNINKKQAMWIAEFEQHTKTRTILYYMAPNLAPSQENLIKIAFIKYPNNMPPFKLIDMSTFKRKKVLFDFMNYIAKYGINSRAVPSAVFKIKYDPNKTMNLVNLTRKLKSFS
jgi:hypothetical protein